MKQEKREKLLKKLQKKKRNKKLRRLLQKHLELELRLFLIRSLTKHSIIQEEELLMLIK